MTRLYTIVLTLLVCLVAHTTQAQETRTFGSPELLRVFSRQPVSHAPYSTVGAPWVQAGIYVFEGEVLNFTAEGEVRVTGYSPPRTADGDGYETTCSTCLVNFGRYGLVGRIGETPGTEFFVGTNYTGVAQQEGWLWFAFNDDYYWDNGGSFYVSGTLSAPVVSAEEFSFHLNPLGEWHDYDVCVEAGEYLTFGAGDYLVQIGESTPIYVPVMGLELVATEAGCISLQAEDIIDVQLFVSAPDRNCEFLPEINTVLQTVIETETIIETVEVPVYVEVEKIVEVPYEVIVEVEKIVYVDVPAEYTREGALAFLRGDNRSGLGDGTNPGKGKGRSHSKNTGTKNPHRTK